MEAREARESWGMRELERRRKKRQKERSKNEKS